MKNKYSKLGLVSLGVATAGMAMKLFHLPASNIALLFGAAGVLFILLPQVVSHLSSSASARLKGVAALTYASAFAVFAGLATKLFHLPAANIVILAGVVIFNILMIRIIRAIA